MSHITQEQAIQNLIEATEDLMTWQVKNVKVWHNSAYDTAAMRLEQLRAALAQPEPVELTNDQMWQVWDDYYGAIPSYDRPAFEPCLYTNMLAAAKGGAL